MGITSSKWFNLFTFTMQSCVCLLKLKAKWPLSMSLYNWSIKASSCSLCWWGSSSASQAWTHWLRELNQQKLALRKANGISFASHYIIDKVNCLINQLISNFDTSTIDTIKTLIIPPNNSTYVSQHNSRFWLVKVSVFSIYEGSY